MNAETVGLPRRAVYAPPPIWSSGEGLGVGTEMLLLLGLTNTPPIFFRATGNCALESAHADHFATDAMNENGLIGK